MKKRYLIALVLLVIACSAGEQQTVGHIVQRSIRPGDRLVIAYRFNAGNRTIADSMEMPNRVVPHDSVTVIFSVQDPAQNHLLLP